MMIPDDAFLPFESEMAKSRGHLYHLLSEFFLREITSEFIETLTGKEVLNAFDDLGIDMRKILDVEGAGLIKDLAEEYAALFLVPGGIPPYESVRFNGLLSQEPAWEVEEFYRRCGLVIRDELRVLPDHFGMELEFMGYLAFKEAGAVSKGDKEEAAKWIGFQHEFFQDHIEKWAFGFLQDLDRYAFHPFYKGVGTVASRFLEVEKEHLTE